MLMNLDMSMRNLGFKDQRRSVAKPRLDAQTTCMHGTVHHGARPRMAINQSSSRLGMPSVEAALTSNEPRSLVPPVSNLDVDSELWTLLDLCSDEELELLYSILYSSSPLSPVVKSLVTEKEPALLELRGRLSVMHKVRETLMHTDADAH